MGFENYYEAERAAEKLILEKKELERQEKRRGFGRAVRLFLVLTILLFIFAILVIGVVNSMRTQTGDSPGWEWSSGTERPEGFGKLPENILPQQSPPSTRFEEERPMVSLDGIVPVLPADGGNPIPDIVEAVAPSVVGVVSYATREGDEEPTELGMGSGFVISSAGYILTNAHVINDAEKVTITLLSGKEVDAEIIAFDNDSDVAVLKTEHKGLAPLKLGDSDDIRVGDYVVAIGNPLGYGFEGTVTMGIISARARVVPIDGVSNYYIQTDAAINVGNSGGPLFNMKGEIIGINTAKTINAGYDEYGDVIAAEGLGFALPINKVMTIAQFLITKGYVPRAALGVMIMQMVESELSEYGLEVGNRVESVAKGGPAEAAGICVGDIIVACDGMEFREQAALVEYINAQPFGTAVTITVYRDGELIPIRVVLMDKSSIDYDSQMIEE